MEYEHAWDWVDGGPKPGKCDKFKTLPDTTEEDAKCIRDTIRKFQQQQRKNPPDDWPM